MNASLTQIATELRVACSRFMTQALAIWARAGQTRLALAKRLSSAARAHFSFLARMMDRAQQVVVERVYERRMAVRNMFLTEPRNPNSPITQKGRKVLAHWARLAHAFAPLQTNDPILLARAEGKREMFAYILGDIFDDLPNLARLMAQEEARQAEEIVNA